MDISKGESLKNTNFNQKNIKVDTKKSAQKAPEKPTVSTIKEVKNFSIKALLDSLFKDLNFGTKSKNEVFTTLKQLNISFSIKDMLGDLKLLAQMFKSDNSWLKSNIKLEDLLLDIKNMSPKNLKNYIQNSGIFLESKLAEIISNKNINNLDPQTLMQIKNEVFNDIKSVLLRAQDKLNHSSNPKAKERLSVINKVLTNIHYYQLLSYSSNSSVLFLPLFWSELDDGKIEIKKLKQNRFFCEINLKLKQYGKIDLFLILFDDLYMDMSFFAEDKDLLLLLKDNLQELKKSITDVGLTTSSLHIFDYSKDDKRKKETKAFIETLQTGEGINIHV